MTSVRPEFVTASAPAVSVIMIFLNAERFMDEAIRSVLAQTFEDWELILVDDGSTDGGSDMARNHAHRQPRRIRYCHHDGHSNLGMSASRNLGLTLARGEYVAFLDADDVFLPQRLERHLALLRGQPDLNMVQGCLEYWRSWRDAAVMDGRDSPPPVKLHSRIPPPTLFALMLQSDGATVPGVCSVTLRRSTLMSLGGFEPVFRSTYEDQVMLAKMYLSQDVWVIDDCLARYRQHANSSLHLAGSSNEYTPSRPHSARLKYLEWLDGYLRRNAIQDPLVWRSVTLAFWPYRHPWLWRLQHLPQETLRAARLAASHVLPRSMLQRLTAWHGSRKDAAAARRARRLSASIAITLNASDRSERGARTDKKI